MARRSPKVGIPIITRATVFAAFRNLKEGPLPSRTLIYSILAVANDRSHDEQPFLGDDLREAYANLYRLLRPYVPYWRKTLKSIKGQTYPTVADDQQELQSLIHDAEVIMKAPIFYHRMSEANHRNKDNVKRQTPINKKVLDLMALMEAANYKPSQARQLVLHLFPGTHLEDANEASKRTNQQHSEKCHRPKGNGR
jgi:hypothetical protein